MHAIPKNPDDSAGLTGSIYGFPWAADYNPSYGDWWLTVDGERLGWVRVPWPLSSAIVDVRERLEWRLGHPLPDWWDARPHDVLDGRAAVPSAGQHQV